MSKKYHFKHQYAFNQFKQVVYIDDAFKNNAGEKYYKDINLTIEFILVNGVIKEKHFRQPSDYFIQTSNGNINSNQINESPEHYNFKMNIIKDGFFIFKDYKIFIENPKDEYILIGSKYRVDLYANFLCGTPLAIEIIKTSDISLAKENYLKENEILTFKIYIDDKGSQELQQFNCYGKREIEHLRDEIIRAERYYIDICTRNGIEKRNVEARLKRENDLLQEQYREYLTTQDNRIEELKSNRAESTENIEYEVRNLREKILYTLRKIKGYRESGSGSVQFIENEIRGFENYLQENDYN